MSNHFISLPEAIDMTTRYRSKKESILDPEFRGKNILLLSETFSRDAIDALLAEADCTSLRIYFGMGVDLQLRVIAVGVDSMDQDLLPNSAETSLAADGSKIVEDGGACPPKCPPPSPLNGG